MDHHFRHLDIHTANMQYTVYCFNILMYIPGVGSESIRKQSRRMFVENFAMFPIIEKGDKIMTKIP